MDDPRDPLFDPEEDPRVLDALGAITSALTTAPDDLTAQRHRRAIANARRIQPLVLVQRTAATGAVAAGLVVALAVGGALPDPAQQVAADVASWVGIELPRPGDDEVPPLDAESRRPAERDRDEAGDPDEVGGRHEAADPTEEGTERSRQHTGEGSDGTGVSGTDPDGARDAADGTPPASPTPPAATPAPSPLPVPAEGNTRPNGPPASPPASTPAPDQRPGPANDADRPSPPPPPPASRSKDAGDEGAALRDEEGRAAPASAPGEPTDERTDEPTHGDAEPRHRP